MTASYSRKLALVKWLLQSKCISGPTVLRYREMNVSRILCPQRWLTAEREIVIFRGDANESTLVVSE